MSWRFQKRETHGQERTKFERRSKTNFRREIKKLNKKYGEDTVTRAMRALSKDEKYIKLPIENQLEILKENLKIRGDLGSLHSSEQTTEVPGARARARKF